jgi:hypothetical protein
MMASYTLYRNIRYALLHWDREHVDMGKLSGLHASEDKLDGQFQNFTVIIPL